MPEACSGGVVSAEYCRDVRIEDCELNGCGICGVLAHCVRGLEIVGNEIHHNSFVGMQLQRCEEVVLQGNRLHDNKGAIRLTDCLPADATDEQPVHQSDEVYYVVSGKGQFTAGEG